MSGVGRWGHLLVYCGSAAALSPITQQSPLESSNCDIDIFSIFTIFRKGPLSTLEAPPRASVKTYIKSGVKTWSSLHLKLECSSTNLLLKAKILASILEYCEHQCQCRDWRTLTPRIPRPPRHCRHSQHQWCGQKSNLVLLYRAEETV